MQFSYKKLSAVLLREEMGRKGVGRKKTMDVLSGRKQELMMNETKLERQNQLWVRHRKRCKMYHSDYFCSRRRLKKILLLNSDHKRTGLSTNLQATSTAQCACRCTLPTIRVVSVRMLRCRSSFRFSSTSLEWRVNSFTYPSAGAVALMLCPLSARYPSRASIVLIWIFKAL